MPLFAFLQWPKSLLSHIETDMRTVFTPAHMPAIAQPDVPRIIPRLSCQLLSCTQLSPATSKSDNALESICPALP